MKQLLLALTALIVIVGCEGTRPLEPGDRPVIPARMGSRFIFQVEHTTTKVKAEDTPGTTTYRTTMDVVSDGEALLGYSDVIKVLVSDEDGTPRSFDNYYLSIDEWGDVFYALAGATNDWTKLPFGTREAVEISRSEGDLYGFYREVISSAKWIGEETITVQGRAFACHIVEFSRWRKDQDKILNKNGLCTEWAKYWFSPELGFFIKRETSIDDASIMKPRWKYSTRETLVEFTTP